MVSLLQGLGLSMARADRRAGIVSNDHANERPCAPLPRKSRREDCCFKPSFEVRRPDPSIYSQPEILRREGLNAHVTWLNPDIEVYAGVPARLLPEASIAVHNRSASVSAAGVRADVYAYRFGIGYARELIGGSRLSIEAGGKVSFLAPLPQRILAGEQRVGIEVRLVHPTDIDAGNNIGLHACQVIHTSTAGRVFNVEVPMRNRFDTPQELYLNPSSTTDLLVTFTPSAGPFDPSEERLVVMTVSAQGLAAGPTVRREMHFRTVTRDPGGPPRVLDEGLSFVINVDA